MMLEERVANIIPDYEKMFAERGDVTPTNALEFHFYHLARYWSRLVGFCRQYPSEPEGWIDGDLGACIQVGSDFADKLIDPSSLIHHQWQDYRKQADAILHERPVTITDVESALNSFEGCLVALNYDPWANPSQLKDEHSF